MSFKGTKGLTRLNEFRFSEGEKMGSIFSEAMMQALEDMQPGGSKFKTARVAPLKEEEKNYKSPIVKSIMEKRKVKLGIVNNSSSDLTSKLKEIERLLAENDRNSMRIRQHVRGVKNQLAEFLESSSS